MKYIDNPLDSEDEIKEKNGDRNNKGNTNTGDGEEYEEDDDQQHEEPKVNRSNSSKQPPSVSITSGILFILLCRKLIATLSNINPSVGPSLIPNPLLSTCIYKDSPPSKSTNKPSSSSGKLDSGSSSSVIKKDDSVPLQDFIQLKKTLETITKEKEQVIEEKQVSYYRDIRIIYFLFSLFINRFVSNRTLALNSQLCSNMNRIWKKRFKVLKLHHVIS